MKQHKKSILLVLSIVLVLVISAGSTLAYLTTRTEDKDNTFAFPEAGVTIEENFDGWDIKEVQVKNDSTIPGVVRVLLLPRIEDAEGNYVSADLGQLSQPQDNKIVMGDFTLELAADWEDNWFYQDGFFYYRKVLEPGATSEKLLQKVSLTEDTTEMRKKYKDLAIKVDVQADFLQAEGGAPESEWGVTVSGSAVAPAAPEGGDGN